MRRFIIFMSVMVVVVICPVVVGAVEESDLPSEVAPRPELQLGPEDLIVFNGYVNSKEVTVIETVMGCFFNLCKDQEDSFCSDEQGILILGGDDSGEVIDVLKTLEGALETKDLVQVTLTKEPYFGGVRRIVDVRLVY